MRHRADAPVAGSMPSLPEGLPRGAVVLLGSATLVVTVAGLRGLAGIVGPVVLALMLTIAVHPLVERLRDRGAPGWVATLVGLIGVYAIVLGMALSLAVSVAKLAQLLPTYQPQFEALVADVASWLGGLGVSADQVQSATSGADLGNAVDLVQGLVSGLASTLSDLLFLVTLLLFMGMDSSGFSDRLKEVSGRRTPVVEALRGFAQGTRRYLVVSTVFGFIVAVIDTIALWWLGVPLPVLWGLLAFITNYIPNIGFVIGLIPPALLGLLEGGWSLMFAVIATYCVINVIIQSVIQPKVIGDSVGLSTTVTFLSLVVWAWILGPLGALLAVPLSLLTKGLLIDIDPDTRWLSPLLSGKPARAEPDLDQDPDQAQDLDGQEQPHEGETQEPSAPAADGDAQTSAGVR